VLITTETEMARVVWRPTKQNILTGVFEVGSAPLSRRTKAGSNAWQTDQFDAARGMYRCIPSFVGATL
jgi:hypothetical protein